VGACSGCLGSMRRLTLRLVGLLLRKTDHCHVHNESLLLVPNSDRRWIELGSECRECDWASYSGDTLSLMRVGSPTIELVPECTFVPSVIVASRLNSTRYLACAEWASSTSFRILLSALPTMSRDSKCVFNSETNSL